MLHHPNVIRLLEVLDSPTRVYLVMELAEQGDMCKYVRTRRKLEESEARRLFIQMLGGLDYMHSKGLVSRRTVRFQLCSWLRNVCSRNSSISLTLTTMSFRFTEILNWTTYYLMLGKDHVSMLGSIG